MQGRPAKLICLMNDPGASCSAATMAAVPLPLSTPCAHEHPGGSQCGGGPPTRRMVARRRVHPQVACACPGGSQEVQPDSERQLGCLTQQENTLGTFTCKHSLQHKQTHKLHGICTLGSSPSSGSVARYGRKHFGV